MHSDIEYIAMLLAAKGYGELSPDQRLTMGESIQGKIHSLTYRRSWLHNAASQSLPTEALQVTVTFNRNNFGIYIPHKCSMVLAREYPGLPGFHTAIIHHWLSRSQLPAFSTLYRQAAAQIASTKTPRQPRPSLSVRKTKF